jgi:hypothetical protein
MPTLLNAGSTKRRMSIHRSSIAAAQVSHRLRCNLSDSEDRRENVSMTANDNRTKVTILTGTYRVKGYIDLLPGARVTDFLTESKDFIAVTDAEVWELGNRHILNAPFINVSRDHIQIVIPED